MCYIFMKLAGSVNSLLVELASGHRLRGLPSSSGSPSLLHVSRLAPLEGWEAGNVRTSPVPAEPGKQPPPGPGPLLLDIYHTRAYVSVSCPIGVSPRISDNSCWVLW